MTMKVKVESTDRVGISQEILATFASQQWNVKSIEVESHFTYAYIDNSHVKLDEVKALLDSIDGIKHCEEILEMPAEQREKHVQALLAKISDPIIDVDATGKILACNPATEKLGDQPDKLLGQSLFDFIDITPAELFQEQEFSLALDFLSVPYIADVNPVVTDGVTTGAVIHFKSVQKVGRQLSIVQSDKDNALQSIIGQSEQMKLVLAQIKRFSELDLPVLINGETGTGKELVARALHQLSPRKDNPFLTINCAAIPEQLLESELFGYESGAFTGAKRGGKPGLFELADGGTVFLDEIAEMSNYLQAKLLRFLQDFHYRKVGGTKERKANVKVISASHQNFTQLIADKLFREDLYYRLNVLKIQLPVLAERREDIELLIHHFIVRAAEQVSQNVPEITAEALRMLSNFNWPGNIRQLENTIFKLIAVSDQVIDAKDVSQILLGDVSGDAEHVSLGAVKDWASAQASFERELLTQMHPFYPTTRKLAERLKVSHNKIAMKLREHDIK